MTEYKNTEQLPPGYTMTTTTGPSEAVMQTLTILEKQLDILAELFRPGPYVIDVPEEEGK